MNIVLKYTGKGEWVPLIPNRDLTDYDIARIAQDRGQSGEAIIEMLCSRGLYKAVKKKPSKTTIRKEMEALAELTIAEKEKDDGNSTNSTKEANTDRE